METDVLIKAWVIDRSHFFFIQFLFCFALAYFIVSARSVSSLFVPDCFLASADSDTAHLSHSD